MEKFNRAVRRHHTARLKKTRKHYWGFGHPLSQTVMKYFRNEEDKLKFRSYALDSRRGLSEMTARQLNTVVQNPAVCSGACCGNARKWQGMTLAEASAHAMADIMMEEI